VGLTIVPQLIGTLMATDKASDASAVEAPADLKEYPGRTLGVVALVFSFFIQLPALIMGIIAWVWSHRVGENNVPAKVAVAVSGALLLLGILLLVGWIALVVSLGGEYGRGFDPEWRMMRGWSS
jgi:hypothetical protein